MLFAIMRRSPSGEYWWRARMSVGGASRLCWDAAVWLPGLQLFRTYEDAVRQAGRIERAISSNAWELWDWFGDEVQVVGWVEYCGDATGHPHEDCAACPALSRACAAQMRAASQRGKIPPPIRQSAER